MYNFPIFSQLILLLHWVLVTINDFLAGLGLGYSWTWGLAIIGLTIIVRLILFPLTWKQYKSAQQMQLIQPQIKELQKKYKSDRGKLQEETMKLYSEHRVNPFASCLPLLLQLPVFISLYAAIKGLGPLSAPAYQASVEALNQAPFLWIPHLGFPDPYYILLILYVVTQMISTELMVATQSDSTQKWIMRAMPIMFVLFLFNFPAGLFVYWVTTNVWTIGQQLIIRRTMPKPEELAAKAKAKPKKRSRFMEVDDGVAGRGHEAARGEDGQEGRRQRRGQAGQRRGRRQEGRARRQEAAARQGASASRPQGGKPGQPGGAKPKSGSGGQQRKARPGRPAAQASRGRPASRRTARPARAATEERPRARTVRRTSDAAWAAHAFPTRPGSRIDGRAGRPPADRDEEEEETEFATIAGGATVEEAKRTALEQLRKIVPYVNPADVEYVVVEEGSKGGLFGRGKMLAQVEARLRPSEERVEADLPEGAEKLREFIQTVVDLMGIEAHVGASETPEWVRAEISGDDLGLLIGRHGATIDALQYVAAIVVNGDRRERRQVIVDAEGYRDRRAAAAHGARRPHGAEGRARVGEHRPQAHDGGGAQGDPSAPQGPPAGRDGLRGQRTVPRRRRLSKTAGRPEFAGRLTVKEGPRRPRR